MCDSSWASTPSSSTRFILSSSPVVTAIAACLGLRPVANALGAGSLTMYTRGLGQAAGDAQALDQVVEAAVRSGSAGLARLTARAIDVGLPVPDEGHGAGEEEGDDGADEAVADQQADGGADERQDEDEPGDQERAPALVGADQFEHDAGSGRTAQNQNCTFGTSRDARRPRSTHACRTSACWRRSPWGTAGACCCSSARCRCRTGGHMPLGPRSR